MGGMTMCWPSSKMECKHHLENNLAVEKNMAQGSMILLKMSLSTLFHIKLASAQLTLDLKFVMILGI